VLGVRHADLGEPMRLIAFLPILFFGLMYYWTCIRKP
jgi:hypothetical protein